MSELETLLREAKDRGELNYISMCYTARGFETVFRGSTTLENVRGVHKTDPVLSMVAALKEGKKGFKSKKNRLPTHRMEDPTPAEDMSFESEKESDLDFG